MNDKYRAAGRTGLAAVLGAKKVKAIYVYGRRRPEVVDKEGFEKANSALAKKVMEDPVSKALYQYGTSVLVNVINSVGAFPTRNWSDAVFEKCL